MNKELSGIENRSFISKRIPLEAEIAFEKMVMKKQIVKEVTEFCDAKCSEAIKDVLGEDDYLHIVMIPEIVKRYLELVKEELIGKEVS